MITKKILFTTAAALFLVTGLQAQDLTAVRLKSDPITYVTFQAPSVRALTDVLAEYGLPTSLSRKAKQQAGNFYLPLKDVLVDSGSSRIWFMTDAAGSVQELAASLGLKADELTRLNKLRSPQLSKGRYILLGYAGTPEALAVVNPSTEPTPNQKAQEADSTIGNDLPKTMPGRDSLAGLAAPKAPGYYEADFAAKGKMHREGRMGLFKSVGGWYDGKFHALCNDVAVGTVVKIENMANGRHVFARVVSKMPGLAEDRNLIIRLSDAGRAALDVWGDNTEVRVVIED